MTLIKRTPVNRLQLLLFLSRDYDFRTSLYEITRFIMVTFIFSLRLMAFAHWPITSDHKTFKSMALQSEFSWHLPRFVAGISDAGENGRGVALADFNGDGKLDVVYGNWNGHHRLYLQKTKGNRRIFQVGPFIIHAPPPYLDDLSFGYSCHISQSFATLLSFIWWDFNFWGIKISIKCLYSASISYWSHLASF